MIKKIVFYFLISLNIFAFKIDSLDFDKEVSIGSYVSKDYTIENTEDYPVKYTIEIEEQKKNKNIKVSPNTLMIPANSKKSFKVEVKGEVKGEHTYFLKLKEEIINLSPSKNQVKIKMEYQIEQTYYCEIKR